MICGKMERVKVEKDALLSEAMLQIDAVSRQVALTWRFLHLNAF